MFEHHNPIFQFIFRHGRGRIGKLSGCTIIGGLVMGVASLGSGDALFVAQWTSFAMLGAAIGFVAAVILVARDFWGGVDVDDGMRVPVRIPPGWASLLFVAAILAAIGTAIVGSVWFADYIQHHP
jgi:hypothetical protein